MTPDTTVQLGDFTFASFEVPERIPFGSSQRLSVKEFVGGDRVIDCMGNSPHPIEWSGWFTGADAVRRGQFLESLAINGEPQQLTWGGFKYQVVVRDFQGDYLRFYRVSYRISCEVASNDTLSLTQVPAPAIDQVMQADLDVLNGLGGAIGDGPLSGLLGGLDTAIKGVSSFANAAQSTINSVLQPLQAVQSRVSTLIAQSGLTLSNVTTFGGLLPNNPASILAQKLTNTTVNMTQSMNLFQARNIVGRMGANLVSINTPPKQIAVAGGNLFQIAAKQYGDATAWTALARANGTTDPFVAGTAVLGVPNRADKSGGVLSA